MAAPFTPGMANGVRLSAGRSAAASVWPDEVQSCCQRRCASKATLEVIGRRMSQCNRHRSHGHCPRDASEAAAQSRTAGGSGGSPMVSHSRSEADVVPGSGVSPGHADSSPGSWRRSTSASSKSELQSTGEQSAGRGGSRTNSCKARTLSPPRLRRPRLPPPEAPLRSWARILRASCTTEAVGSHAWKSRMASAPACRSGDELPSAAMRTRLTASAATLGRISGPPAAGGIVPSAAPPMRLESPSRYDATAASSCRGESTASPSPWTGSGGASSARSTSRAGSRQRERRPTSSASRRRTWQRATSPSADERSRCISALRPRLTKCSHRCTPEPVERSHSSRAQPHPPSSHTRSGGGGGDGDGGGLAPPRPPRTERTDRRGLTPQDSAAASNDAPCARRAGLAGLDPAEHAAAAAAHCCSTTCGASHPDRARSAAARSRQRPASSATRPDAPSDWPVRRHRRSHCEYSKGVWSRVANQDAVSRTKCSAPFRASWAPWTACVSGMRAPAPLIARLSAASSSSASPPAGSRAPMSRRREVRRGRESTKVEAPRPPLVIAPPVGSLRSHAMGAASARTRRSGGSTSAIASASASA
eukprot:scaffold12640_cov106-Isochrysis_galbana.AAC.9